ncbi:leucine-rich repeat domain-containing protein [Myxococcus landrumensis]|uniref:leucine-rich repeat domain-containing protein n=1 Tax=Myxococcus landrumensis TaxID=2813577 RepID=UPI001F507D60|nr:leucine-rich repeat domain-containing protein [Myxococcus landrumus]
MAEKKPSSPRASPSSKKPEGPAPEALWLQLEQQLRDALGPDAVGQYPAELEPMSWTFEQALDAAGLLPDGYQRFVAALGYRWLNTGKKGLAFLPPRWRAQASQGMGEPGRQWTQVREEREAGRHTWRFVMFASEDLNDVNGFCFGQSAQGDSLVVWQVEDSLPEKELGPFDAWLTKKLAALTKAAGTAKSGARKRELGDPLGLVQDSLGELGEEVRATGAAAILGTFPRDTKSIQLLHRKLGVVPDMVAEFTELESLELKGAALRHLPPVLARLTKLQRLNVDGNPDLDTLPPELAQLQELEQVSVQGTGIRVVPEVLSQLPKLRYLSLKATPITTLPEWLSRMPHLKTLDVAQTSIPAEEIQALKQAHPDWWLISSH